MGTMRVYLVEAKTIMAYYAIQPKGMRWILPEIIKLNLTTKADITRLEELREKNENVYKISYTSYKNRTYAVVEDNLVSVWSKSSLKVEALQRAVKESWSYEETMRVLYDMKPSERKKLFRNRSGGINKHATR
jgi:hypothetical protein